MPTSTVLFEPDNDADLDLLVKLAARLGVKTTLGPPNDPSISATVAAARTAYLNALLHKVYGSWQSDESGEELVKQIYEARTNNSRRDDEIELLMNGPRNVPPTSET